MNCNVLRSHGLFRTYSVLLKLSFYREDSLIFFNSQLYYKNNDKYHSKWIDAGKHVHLILRADKCREIKEQLNIMIVGAAQKLMRVLTYSFLCNKVERTCSNSFRRSYLTCSFSLLTCSLSAVNVALTCSIY